MNYTKGEWKVTSQNISTKPFRIDTTSKLNLKYDVADIYIAIHEDTKDNAFLIAAAPDMYEALKQGLEVLQNQGSYCMDTQIKMKQALAKAEGVR